MAMKGRDKHMKRLKSLEDGVGDAANKALRVIAQKIRADAKRSITAGSVSGKNHLPSKPGEPPNNDTGTLAAGLVDETFPAQLRAEVRAEAAYSSALEFGTSKMAARPFMRAARDANRDFAQGVFAEAMNDFVKRSGR